MTPDQPKPATGEWTADDVAGIFNDAPTDDNAYKRIADAHNAALAAATLDLRIHLENGRQIHNAACDRILQLDKQLAAAFRAGASKLKFEAENELDQIGDLQKQLAAEKEKYKQLEKSVLDMSLPCLQQLIGELVNLRKQLSVLRAKVK